MACYVLKIMDQGFSGNMHLVLHTAVISAGQCLLDVPSECLLYRPFYCFQEILVRNPCCGNLTTCSSISNISLFIG